MSTDVMSEADLAALSQDSEMRLRALESAIMVLMGMHVMTLNKVKLKKEEVIADIEMVAAPISFSQSNYPPYDGA